MDKFRQTIHDRSSSVRMRMMDWMRLAEYEWWLVFTDCMPDQTPKFYWRFAQWFGSYTMSFGCDYQDNKHTGPPHD